MPPSGRSVAHLFALARTSLSDLRVAPSRYGHGDALWLGHRELAHRHSPTEFDVRLKGPLQRTAALRLETPKRKKRADWIAVLVKGDADLRCVAELLAAAYREAR